MQGLLRRSAPLWLLTLLCAALYLPGLATLPPFDRDEARFAQASKQMLESGDWLVPQFQDQPRSKKPAGIYWLQAASVAGLSEGHRRAIWAYRVPSVLGAWAAVLLTYALGCCLAGRPAALLGAALLAGSLLLAAEAHQAKTDAVLLATVLLTLWGAARGWAAWQRDARARDPGAALTFWGGLGLSALIKGPIGPAVVLLALPALCLAGGGWRWLRPLGDLRAVGLFLVLAGGWPAALAVTGDFGFLWASAQEDLIPKLLSGQESHGAPPGYHLLLLYAGFWPVSLVILPALAGVWRRMGHPGLRFCLAWALPGWLLFELVPTKLPHYVLPLYPALALAAAIVLVEAPTPAASDRRAGWLGRLGRLDWLSRLGAWLTRCLYWAHLGLWTLLGLGLALAMVVLPQVFAESAGLWAYGPAVVTALGTLGVARLAATRRGAVPALASLLLAAAVFPLLAQVHAPRLDHLWVARTAMAHLPPPGQRPPLAAAGYHEPSLVFLAGTDTHLTTGPGAAAALAEAPGRTALVAGAARAGFETAAEDRGLALVAVTSFPGFNYSKGERLTVTLYRHDPPAETPE